MTFMRITAGTALIATLAACGGGDLMVRDGPQAVHPSGSFLANGSYLAMEGDQVAPSTTCHHHADNCHAASGHSHSYSGNDGSRPIVD